MTLVKWHISIYFLLASKALAEQNTEVERNHISKFQWYTTNSHFAYAGKSTTKTRLFVHYEH